jgi:hypothetical protein
MSSEPVALPVRLTVDERERKPSAGDVMTTEGVPSVGGKTSMVPNRIIVRKITIIGLVGCFIRTTQRICIRRPLYKIDGLT